MRSFMHNGRPHTTAIDIYAKAENINGCLILPINDKKRPYPYFHINKIKISAHRISYALNFGDPLGGLVKHKCDIKQCINPHHLELGTYSENISEAYSRGLRGKLTQKQRDEIISCEFTDGTNNASLARKYGVSITAIWLLRKRHRG